MIIRRKERKEKRRERQRERERGPSSSEQRKLSAAEESAREEKSAVSAVNGAIFVERSSAHSATCGSTCVTYRRLADR